MGDVSSLARNVGYDWSLAHPIHSKHLGHELVTAKLDYQHAVKVWNYFTFMARTEI